MDAIELPHGDSFEVVRDEIDDLLRRRADELGPYCDACEDERVDEPLLASWMVLTYWTDRMDGHHYVRICSRHLSPHAREGLLQMFMED